MVSSTKQRRRTDRQKTKPAASRVRQAGRDHKDGPDRPKSNGDASAPTKLDLLLGLLSHQDGASIDEMMAATGWQAHSVRGALAGALKKKGHVITSERVGNVRRYRIGTGR